jgi:hypothetical protein
LVLGTWAREIVHGAISTMVEWCRNGL